MHTERHVNVKNFEGICLKQLRSGVTARNTSDKANMLIYRLTRGQLSPHDAGQGTGGCRAMIKSLQPCPKRYLLMQLARVAPRLAVYGHSLRYKRTRKRMNYGEERLGMTSFRACVLVYARRPRGCSAVCAEGLHSSAFHHIFYSAMPHPSFCSLHTTK